MTRFLLVRHAAHEDVGAFLAGRKPGVCLGEAGLAQADRLGRRLSTERLLAVHTSPRERTRQTADAICARTGSRLVLEPALDEIDFGRWSGLRFDELESDPEWRRWNAARSVARTPAGETMWAAQGRILGVIDSLLDTCDANVALVTHADLIKAAVAYYLGLSLDGLSRLEISPASVTTLVVEPWGARVLCMNDTVDGPQGRGEI